MTPLGNCFDDRLGALSRAILDPARPVPQGLVGPDGQLSARRFAVYRNNVVAGLIEVLRAAYPVVRRIVGEDFFAAMARIHVAASPPESPIMLDYGRHFPAFLEGFPPVATLPYLADVARIERGWLEAYHAAEAAPLNARQLAAVPPDRIPLLRLTLHPSVRILQSDFPALTIWRMNVQGGVPGPVDLASGGETTLIARPGAEVELRATAADVARFVEILLQGHDVQSAVLAGIGRNPRFDPSAALSGLMTLGLITWAHETPKSEG